MTALRLADTGEAADLAAFLARLLRYDRRAAVRLQGSGEILAVFGRPASFEVLAIRTARLAEPYVYEFDTTVSAGQLADAVDAAPVGPLSDRVVTVPEPVTGPPWAGALPPRTGWQRVEGLPEPEEVRSVVAAAVREFRSRSEALPQDRRTRAERDRIGREIWSRTLGDTGLPLRAVHAAQALGFLRELPAARGAAVPAPHGNHPHGNRGAPAAVAQKPPEALALFAAGTWLRLRTPFGSIAVCRAGLSGLSLTPA